ncbi:hypothetical protein LX36DRAFT_664481 [Colletotrichum falcatum]|nr:hypothetical protein LX36DRAFT_664481 [Colletotrichum falcatum]
MAWPKHRIWPRRVSLLIACIRSDDAVSSWGSSLFSRDGRASQPTQGFVPSNAPLARAAAFLGSAGQPLTTPSTVSAPGLAGDPRMTSWSGLPADATDIALMDRYAALTASSRAEVVVLMAAA